MKKETGRHTRHERRDGESSEQEHVRKRPGRDLLTVLLLQNKSIARFIKILINDIRSPDIFYSLLLNNTQEVP
jgi:hypothetical protein